MTSLLIDSDNILNFLDGCKAYFVTYYFIEFLQMLTMVMGGGGGRVGGFHSSATFQDSEKTRLGMI